MLRLKKIKNPALRNAVPQFFGFFFPFVSRMDSVNLLPASRVRTRPLVYFGRTFHAYFTTWCTIRFVFAVRNRTGARNVRIHDKIFPIKPGRSILILTASNNIGSLVEHDNC